MLTLYNHLLQYSFTHFGLTRPVARNCHSKVQFKTNLFYIPAMYCSVNINKRLNANVLFPIILIFNIYVVTNDSLYAYQH